MTGYESKRAAAQDKLAQESVVERAWFTIDELNAWADKKLVENPHWVMPAEEPERKEALEQPAQEPVAMLFGSLPVYDTAPPQPAQEQKCWCTTCRPITMSDMRFVVCPDCGNKRCPKANDHCNACTGSNEVGQKGSSWEHVKPLAQPAQEPVAWLTRDSVDGCWYATAKKVGKDDKPLYTTPPQPKQEPVAWSDIQKEAQQIVESKFLWKKFIDGTPLSNDIACWMADFAQQYTAPPQRTWVDLTDEEIDELRGSPMKFENSAELTWVRIIEAALRSKNNG